VDPPLQRTFKRLVNAHFTQAKVGPWEEPTRALVSQLIDGFIERGECEFMTEFARPLPGLAFFSLALHAPTGELAQVNDWATLASLTHREESHDALMTSRRIGIMAVPLCPLAGEPGRDRPKMSPCSHCATDLHNGQYCDPPQPAPARSFVSDIGHP
jgi:hypothetical protein